MKAAIYTLGCKVNQTESEYISEILKASGYEIVSPDDDADYYIVNSCTVTAVSDKKTRQSVRHFKREHPSSAVILLGCFPQAFPDDARAFSDADIVLGNKNPDSLPNLIQKYEETGERQVEIDAHTTGESFTGCKINSFGGRIRAFVKIEDGCDRFCSYCIIPYSRGRVRSKPINELKDEVNNLSLNGVREIVLVGINLSAYGRDFGLNIADAVEACAANPGILRVRLGSLEPDHITDDILARLAKIQKFCPQFHLSLQSGCKATLQRMNRHYTPAYYAELIRKIRNQFNNASVTTDIMVGFNGESDAEFSESAAFVRSMNFEKAHIFPYSERAGTAAQRLGGAIPKAQKEARAATIKEITDASRNAFLTSFIGSTEPILFESRNGNTYRGYTPNYAPVKVTSASNLIGTERDVKITRADGEFCYGSVI